MRFNNSFSFKLFLSFILLLSSVVILFFVIPKIVSRDKLLDKSSAKNYSIASNKLQEPADLPFVENWPKDESGNLITNIDAHEIWYENGKYNQIIIKGRRYYVRQGFDNNRWYKGTIFSEGFSPGFDFKGVDPRQGIDSFAVFLVGKDRYLLATKGNVWFLKKNNEKWSQSGYIFSQKDNKFFSGKGAIRKPSNINSLTVFNWVSPTVPSVTITFDKYFMVKKNANSDSYDIKGFLSFPLEFTEVKTDNFSGYSEDYKVDSHTVFYWKGKLAELFTRGDNFVFKPDVTRQSEFIFGKLGQKISSTVTLDQQSFVKQGKVSKKIFGVNLIWHEPFNAYKEPSKLFRALSQLGVTVLRFPGGCGGDSFDWNLNDSKRPAVLSSVAANYPINNNSVGTKLSDFFTIIRRASIEPVYTFSFEAYGNSVNQNCHNLPDYPGNLDDFLGVLDEFEKQGLSSRLKLLEIGNEPWAGKNTNLPNWRENWTVGKYLELLSRPEIQLKRRVNNYKIVAAFPGDYDKDWSSKLIEKKHLFDYLQLHPYIIANSEEEEKVNFPINQPEKAERKIVAVKKKSNKPIFISEYNTYCWSGVQPYKYSPYVGTVSHGFYLAKMFFYFVKNDVEYATLWNLYNGQNSGWKCGLLNSDYSLTNLGQIFSLFSNKILSNYYFYDIDNKNIKVLFTFDENRISIFVINQSPYEFNFTLSSNILNRFRLFNRNFFVEKYYAQSLKDSNFRRAADHNIDISQKSILLPKFSILNIRNF